MKTSTVVWILVVIIVIVGLGWYVYANNSTMAPATTPTTTPVATNPTTAGPVVLQTATGPLGTYLVDAANGLTLYSYSPDTPGVSNCTGQCAVNWPPYIVDTSGGVTVAPGITGAVTTLVRADGTTQLTYNGTPLYTYIKDTKAGDTTGQGVGGTWYVVHP